MKDFIKQQIKILAFRSVEDQEPLISSKILDSIIAVDLAVALEEEYKVGIPFTEINETNFESVERIVNYLQTRLPNGQGKKH
jgi:D-alanine--poly(phosphoribitol) ligase subunit 2